MILPALVPIAGGSSPEDRFSSMTYPPYNSSAPLVHRQKKTYPRKGRDGPGRPANAFVLFRASFADENKHLKLSVQEMSRKAGESWHALCGTRKAVWKVKADEKKAKHARKHPDYRYRPKRRHRSPKEDDSSKPPKGRRSQIELEGPGSSLSNSSVLPISKTQNHLFSQNEQSNEASSSVECPLARPISRRAFTTNDGLWTPALDLVNIARSGIAYPNLPSSERNRHQVAIRRCCRCRMMPLCGSNTVSSTDGMFQSCPTRRRQVHPPFLTCRIQ
jgi:hypothetical protein